MKLTQTKLKELIKEELDVIEEGPFDRGFGGMQVRLQRMESQLDRMQAILQRIETGMAPSSDDIETAHWSFNKNYKHEINQIKT